MSVAQLLYLWAAWLYLEQPKCTAKEMSRETKIQTCPPFTLVPFTTPAMVILCTEVPGSQVCHLQWQTAISMNLLQTKVPWQKVCTDSSVMGFAPVFSAWCPLSLSPSLLRKTVYWLWVLSAPAMDILCFNSRGISLFGENGSTRWFLWSVCSFCQSYAHAVVTPLPAWVSGHLCAESFFPSHSIALQCDKWPFHSIFTESTPPFFLLPASHPLSPWHPLLKLWEHFWHKKSHLGAQYTLPQPQPPGPPASAELSWALGGLLRSSNPAKRNALPDKENR